MDEQEIDKTKEIIKLVREIDRVKQIKETSRNIMEINDKFNKMTMWGHWRASLTIYMILWTILKFSAPTVVTWGWLLYPLGTITIGFLVVGIVKRCLK